MKHTNALAELAELMNSPVELMPGAGDSFVGLNRNQLEAYKKAQRIIAELAKVQDEEATLFSMENITADEARRIVRQREGNCILKCHAIAEEGKTE